MSKSAEDTIYRLRVEAAYATGCRLNATRVNGVFQATHEPCNGSSSTDRIAICGVMHAELRELKMVNTSRWFPRRSRSIDGSGASDDPAQAEED